MSYLILETQNKSDIELLIAFAKSINAKVIEIVQQKKPENTTPVDWLEKLAKNGGIQSIEDPALWQKAIRKDKPLLTRE